MSLDDLLVEVEAKHAALCHAKAELATALISFHSAADDRDYRYVQDEVSSALHISRRGADRILSNASELTDRPLVLAALRAGEIDESKALLIVDQVRILREPHASIAEANLLAYAPTRTYTSIRRRAQVLIHKLDPAAAERRHEEKRKDRLVQKINLDDGMAELRHTMTAHDTAMAFDHLDHIAKSLPKDDRSQTMVYLTMPITALLGLTKDPGMLAGYGPIPTSVAQDIAAGGIWKRILTDPMTGMAEEVSGTYRPTAKQRELINARYPRCTAIGCQQPSHRCDVDHCCPFDGANTTIRNLRPKCRHHHTMKTHSNWRCVNRPDGSYAWITPGKRVHETALEPIAEPAPF